MKLKDLDLIKDFQEFKDTFNSYSGLTPSTMTNNDLIQWMTAVTEELARLHSKINLVIKEQKIADLSKEGGGKK